MKPIPVGALLLAALIGCTDQPTSEEIQNNAQERANLQAVQSVGMPAIRNFWEKRQLQLIYQKRDNAFPTVSYLEDREGKLHKFCDSVGYGIPYATQYSNPVQASNPGNSGNIAIAQAEPNGLYSPPQAMGTWVLCLSTSKKMEPTYVEDNVDALPADVIPYNLAK